MIDPKHELPVTRQAELVSISRAAVYYVPRPIPHGDLALQRRIDALHLEYPFAGSRLLKKLLRGEGYQVGRPHTALADRTPDAAYFAAPPWITLNPQGLHLSDPSKLS